MTERVHICFNGSAGGSLLRALSLLGRTERVLSDADDLACGPIDPLSPEQRAEFASDVLGCDDPELWTEQTREFWTTASRTDVTWVAWLSRRCAGELAGLMELLSRQDASPLVVDIADIEIMRGGQRSHHASRSAGAVSAEEMIAYGMFDRAAPLSEAQSAAYRDTWARLKRENAPLRVLDDTGLVSAPATYFDELLLSLANEWTSMARVVGEAITTIERGPYRQVTDPFLFSRMYTLVDDGQLDVREGRSRDGRPLVRRPAR